MNSRLSVIIPRKEAPVMLVAAQLPPPVVLSGDYDVVHVKCAAGHLHHRTQPELPVRTLIYSGDDLNSSLMLPFLSATFLKRAVTTAASACLRRPSLRCRCHASPSSRSSPCRQRRQPTGCLPWRIPGPYRRREGWRPVREAAGLRRHPAFRDSGKSGSGAACRIRK